MTPIARRNVALVNKYIGGWYSRRQQFDLAEPRYRRALELDELAQAADPADRRAQFDLAIDLANVATVLANRACATKRCGCSSGASPCARRGPGAIRMTCRRR